MIRSRQSTTTCTGTGRISSIVRFTGVAMAIICASACGATNGDEATATQRSAVTSTAGLDVTILFDWQYYVSLYPDLQAAIGNNPSALTNHWLTHGIYEGRRASPVFDCSLYLGLYPDLQAAFGADCAAAMRHFLNTGLPIEGRRASTEFDVRSYLNTYADLKSAFGATGFGSAANHFMTLGLWKEGRAGSNEFNVAYYICHYPDLVSVFNGDYRSAAEHFVRIGLPTEGRRGSATFDVQYYLNQYSDLKKAFGTNYQAAMNHWLINGIGEKRSGNPNDGGGPAYCPTGTPINLPASATTALTGFPTSWFGFPLPSGTLSLRGLSGTLSVTNSENTFSEVLFILGMLPSGACTSGLWPDSTPEFGPAGIVYLGNFIVKAPTQGTFTLPVNFSLPNTGVAMSNCLMLGLNGGTVTTPHNVTSTSNLTAYYVTGSSKTHIGVDGEICFGQSTGCEAATTDSSQSFARVVKVPAAGRLTSIYGDISDSTFDGTSYFGAPPAGAWTTSNDLYVFHKADCANLTTDATGITAAGKYYQNIPLTAIHLMSAPLSGYGIGVANKPIFQALNTTVLASDCLVQLFGGNPSGGAFDNETQLSVMLTPTGK